MVRRSFTAACVYSPPRFDDWMNPCAVNTTNSRVEFMGFFHDPLVQFHGSLCIDYTIQKKEKCDTKKGNFVSTKPSKQNCEFMKECMGGPRVSGRFDNTQCKLCGGDMMSWAKWRKNNWVDKPKMVANDQLLWVKKAESSKNSYVYGVEMFSLKDIIRGLKEKLQADDEGRSVCRCSESSF